MAPTTQQIKQARLDARLTQAEAGAVVHVSKRGWQDWELGVRDINPAAWELFLLKTKKERRKYSIT